MDKATGISIHQDIVKNKKKWTIDTLNKMNEPQNHYNFNPLKVNPEYTIKDKYTVRGTIFVQ